MYGRRATYLQKGAWEAYIPGYTTTGYREGIYTTLVHLSHPGLRGVCTRVTLLLRVLRGVTYPGIPPP